MALYWATRQLLLSHGSAKIDWVHTLDNRSYKARTDYLAPLGGTTPGLLRNWRARPVHLSQMQGNWLIRALPYVALVLLALTPAWLVYAWISGKPFDPNILVGSASAGALVLAAVIANVNGRIQQSKLQIEEELREKRNPVYAELVKTFMATLMPGSGNKVMTPNRLQDAFAKITPDLILWASDDAVREWSRWRTQSAARLNEQAPQEALGRDLIGGFERLLYILRKDLGYSGESLSEGDLLGLFINDAPTVFPNPAPMPKAYDGAVIITK